MAFLSGVNDFFVRNRHPVSVPAYPSSGASLPGFETPVVTSAGVLAAHSSGGLDQAGPASPSPATPGQESGKKARSRRQPLSLATVALIILSLAMLPVGIGAYSSVAWASGSSSYCSPLLPGWGLISVEGAPVLLNLAAWLRLLLHTPWGLCGLVPALKNCTHRQAWLWSVPVYHMYLNVAVAIASSTVAFLSCDFAGGSCYAAASHTLLAAAILTHVHQCVVPSRDPSRDRPANPSYVPSHPGSPEGVWSGPGLQTHP